MIFCQVYQIGHILQQIYWESFHNFLIFFILVFFSDRFILVNHHFSNLCIIYFLFNIFYFFLNGLFFLFFHLVFSRYFFIHFNHLIIIKVDFNILGFVLLFHGVGFVHFRIILFIFLSLFWYFFGFLHLSWFIVFLFAFFFNFQEDVAIFHEGDFTWNSAIGSNSVDKVKLLRIDQEFSCIFVAYWAFPASVSGCHHKGQKCFQVEALAMLAFVASDWGFDEIPGVRIINTHRNPIYFHFFFRGFHEFLDEVSNFR